LHFNLTQTQILQLELRMAVCGLIENYSKFAKDNEGIWWDRRRHKEMAPGTFDALEQLTALARKSRENSLEKRL
jgi:hypothetical protein